jgi:hypothetical protein
MEIHKSFFKRNTNEMLAKCKRNVSEISVDSFRLNAYTKDRNIPGDNV